TPQAYCNRAAAVGAHGDKAKMEADFAHALKINPHYLEAYTERGYCYIEQGDYEAALSDFRHVLRISHYMNPRAPYLVIFGVVAARMLDRKDEATMLLSHGV